MHSILFASYFFVELSRERRNFDQNRSTRERRRHRRCCRRRWRRKRGRESGRRRFRRWDKG